MTYHGKIKESRPYTFHLFRKHIPGSIRLIFNMLGKITQFTSKCFHVLLILLVFDWWCTYRQLLLLNARHTFPNSLCHRTRSGPATHCKNIGLLIFKNQNTVQSTYLHIISYLIFLLNIPAWLSWSTTEAKTWLSVTFTQSADSRAQHH